MSGNGPAPTESQLAPPDTPAPHAGGQAEGGGHQMFPPQAQPERAQEAAAGLAPLAQSMELSCG